MSIKVRYHVTCDNCKATVEVMTSSLFNQKRLVRDGAKRLFGWRYARTKNYKFVDLCPTCLEVSN